MSKINSLIEDFSPVNLITFLRGSIPSFKPNNEDLDYLFQEDIYHKYESIVKIGEAEIDQDELIVIASKTNEPLTERTGKKNQYQIAKTILKHEVKDASIFVFYDDEGNFRFSFVKANYLGTKRDFTDFKRYTYFVTPSQTNKTFIKQVGGCNFNSLDEIIQAFSVEPLNKQFYQDIAKSFYGLIGGKVQIGNKNEEFETAMELYGDEDLANAAEQHRIQIPEGCRWSDVLSTTKDIGKALQDAFRYVETTNPHLYGIYKRQYKTTEEIEGVSRWGANQRD